MSLCSLPEQESLLVCALPSPLYSTRKLCRPWTRVSLVHVTCHVSWESRYLDPRVVGHDGRVRSIRPGGVRK